MKKKERIEELEREVESLKNRVSQIEALLSTREIHYIPDFGESWNLKNLRHFTDYKGDKLE